jgi:hypothetical protein
MLLRFKPRLNFPDVARVPSGGQRPAVTHTVNLTLAGQSGPVEVMEIPHMGGVSIRKTLQAAVSASSSSVLSTTELWMKAARRLIKISKDVKFYDAIAILRAFHTMSNEVAHSALYRKCFHELGQSMENQISQMAPKHILDAIAAYERLGVRPKSLYTSLFLQLQKLLPVMYSDETAGMMQVFVRYGIKQDKLLESIAAEIIERKGSELKFIHCCEIAGAFGHLEFTKMPELYEVLEKQVEREVGMMRPNEMFAMVRNLEFLETSWKPFERILHEQGFSTFVANLRGADEIEQVAHPAELFAYLRFKNLLSDATLDAFANWALVAAKRDKLPMSKRIEMDDLAVITDLCYERGIAVDTAKLALDEFAKVEAGIPPEPPAPIQYARRRRYFRKLDAYVKARLVPVRGSPAPRRDYKQSPGQWISGEGRKAAWLNFPLPWYYNR